MRRPYKNPYFRAAVELMKKDAIFVDNMWKLCYLDRVEALLHSPIELSGLANELGQKLAKHYGFGSDEVSLWLSYNVCDVVDYFSTFHRFGTIPHKASGVSSFFRCIFLERRIPSKDERDAILPVVCNLFFTTLCPFFSLLGTISMRPIVTGIDRIYFMIFGLVLIITAKISTAAYKHPLGGYGKEHMRRRMGGRGIITPLKAYLSAEVIEGIGKVWVFYAIGTFLHEAYTIWELIVAFITGAIVLFEIMNYATSYKTNKST